MANLTNPWVGYLNRSYQTIKNSIMTRLGKTIPEMTDHSESNIMVAVIDAVAGVAEMLGYYIDNAARESHISTARRYSSALKLSRLVDYRVKSNYPASADLLIEFFNSAGDVLFNSSPFNIPEGSVFKTETGLVYISTQQITVGVGVSSVIVPVEQKILVSNENLGLIEGVPNELVKLPIDYVEGSVTMDINLESWELKPTLAYSKPTDKHFIVEISTEKIPFIKFGDGTFGEMPTAGFTVITSYYITSGVAGNVDANLINDTDFNFNISNIDADNLTIKNQIAASGGAGFQSLNDLKKAIPLSIRTLERAVSRQDYIDVCNLAPSVAASEVDYKCGDPYISLYIYPIGGGVAQSSLLNNVEAFMETRINFPTIIKAFPAGVSELRIYADVIGKPGKKAADIRLEIETALEERYGSDISIINRNIRESDIISIIDNQPSVDYLNFDSYYLVPFLNPINHSNILNMSFNLLNYPGFVRKYQIYYFNTTDSFDIYYLNSKQADLVKNVSYTDADNLFNITVPNVSFGTDLVWDFYVYPNSNNISIEDFSVPVFSKINSGFTITEKQ